MDTVYLIHFARPLGDPTNPRGQARHYLGYTQDLPSRLQAHRSGNGAAIMAAVAEQGIGWHVARTWEGDRALERQLKNRKNTPRLCPVCTEQKRADRARRLGGLNKRQAALVKQLFYPTAADVAGFRQYYQSKEA